MPNDLRWPENGCHAWVDDGHGGKILCGYPREAHRSELVKGQGHEFVSRAEYEAQGAKGFDFVSAPQQDRHCPATDAACTEGGCSPGGCAIEKRRRHVPPEPQHSAQSAAGMLADMRKAREQAEAEIAHAVGEATKTGAYVDSARAYSARDALVRIDHDCVVNPAAIVGMLEDVTTHRNGTFTERMVRTSIFLASRQTPLVVELPLDEVLRRITTSRYDEFSDITRGDGEIVQSLIGEGG